MKGVPSTHTGIEITAEEDNVLTREPVQHTCQLIVEGLLKGVVRIKITYPDFFTKCV